MDYEALANEMNEEIIKLRAERDALLAKLEKAKEAMQEAYQLRRKDEDWYFQVGQMQTILFVALKQLEENKYEQKK